MADQIDTFKFQGMAPLLQVFDMPTSLHFYRGILGFKVIQSSGQGDDVDWVLLQYNDIYIMLNTAYEKPMRPPAADHTRKAAHSDTALFFNCPDIDSAYQYLIGKGISLKKPATTGYGWKGINFSDPDGYHICFHWPLEDDEGNS